MRIRILGAHSSTAGSAGCATLLIDNRLAVDAGSVASALSLEEQSRIQAVLISHQHYDHLRDLPLLALNLFRRGRQVAVYAGPAVLDSLSAHIFNGELYPRFQHIPSGSPTLNFCGLEPLVTTNISGYDVRPVPVNHGRNTTGFAIADSSGNKVFYTADTGAGLRRCWEEFSPQILFIEVTLPDRCRDYATRTGHLTPAMLLAELDDFYRMRGYLPRVVAVHLDPSLEGETRTELAEVSEILRIPLTIACEGMEMRAEEPAPVF